MSQLNIEAKWDVNTCLRGKLSNQYYTPIHRMHVSLIDYRVMLHRAGDGVDC